ncbi:MAG: response regulator transcription factor [Anaerolineales bacterium]|nr:response regulator transcription factor [Anaerolineales bacterium]
MSRKIYVSILDDHQSIIDGYLYRLNGIPQIEVVATLAYGEELGPALAGHPTDVLLLDINVPTAPDNPNPYPILHTIPRLLQIYSRLNVLVISMFAERGLIRAVMESGASGYILKDDQATLRDLGNVVLSIAGGGIYFSQKAHQLLLRQKSVPSGERLTARQLEALSLCAAHPNCTTEELAQMMIVSNSTVRNLLSGAYIRLGVRTRAAAIDRARHLGLITPLSPPYQGY